jgi:CheY-like chemotaxis protein
MKFTARCHDCGMSWPVEERSVGGETLCPTCMARVYIGARPELGDAAPGGASTAALDRKPVAETPVEIVCPRCNLHFAPDLGSSPSQAGRRRTVLVVERHEYFREIVVEALTPGCAVKVAADMDEARAMLASGGIDLLVLNLRLDDSDAGPALLRSFAPKPCPILVLAQDESAIDAPTWDALRLAGADDLAVKGMRAGEQIVRKAAALLDLVVDEGGRIR